uniref:DNA polymerase delta subunit 4 n=1 Tax=Aegilops tauschii subsp. strangulata TaxID=200361 RepID=A0A452ZKK2_AEGTS
SYEERRRRQVLLPAAEGPLRRGGHQAHRRRLQEGGAPPPEASGGAPDARYAAVRPIPTPPIHHGGGADAGREDAERKAREFDMDMRYGPCLGLTRAQRWQRAAALGLAPPPHALCSDDQPCIWEGRV